MPKTSTKPKAPPQPDWYRRRRADVKGALLEAIAAADRGDMTEEAEELKRALVSLVDGASQITKEGEGLIAMQHLANALWYVSGSGHKELKLYYEQLKEQESYANA